MALPLLSDADGEVLAELLRAVGDDRGAHDPALGGFTRACARTEENERCGGTPLLPARHARAASDGDRAARGIAEL
ncbi:hypothetical protein [Streptomyces sp. CAU 1734]|uniref:hypothetical protein n=1 Tax=Streptomyces sp. CAU 1734 TaxID=3140360 RepID=UPI0032607815